MPNRPIFKPLPFAGLTAPSTAFSSDASLPHTHSDSPSHLSHNNSPAPAPAPGGLRGPIPEYSLLGAFSESWAVAAPRRGRSAR
eukprot:CAMPEP_0174895254 /NCGR_PEP_ID=MMETSP0167-20121228/9700_1 /TAXON_ID=38298 /ORGANISM="Rhodella maculata, Strain CCMP736" /LENGTH=83 /DNA_ID=CAMNT_0016134537 /DNA_START=42 /DNA_END=290 /DNA_ORIENTATION=+